MLGRMTKGAQNKLSNGNCARVPEAVGELTVLLHEYFPPKWFPTYRTGSGLSGAW